MNNKKNDQNRALLDNQRNSATTAYGGFLSGVNSDLSQARQNSSGLRGTIQDRYSNSNNFMPPGMAPNANGWFNLPDDGGSFPSIGADYSAAKAGYGKFAETGGIDRGDFEPALGSYKNFINNGGVGESEADTLRARATAMVPSFYQGYKNSLARRSNVQGGYSPGYDAQMKEIGRDAARGGFEASRQVEGDILDRRQQGRMFGTSGYGNLMSDITGKEQSGRLAGLSGLKGIGDSEMSASSANAGLSESRAARNQQLQLALQQLYSTGARDSASGLQGLYSSAPGDVGQAYQAWLSGQGASSGNALNNLGQRNAIQDRSWMDLVPGLVGMAGGLFGGMGGMGGGRRPQGRPMPQYSGGFE